MSLTCPSPARHTLPDPHPPDMSIPKPKMAPPTRLPKPEGGGYIGAFRTKPRPLERRKPPGPPMMMLKETALTMSPSPVMKGSRKHRTKQNRVR